VTHRRQAEILAEIGRRASLGEVSAVAGGRFARWLRHTPRHRQTIEVRLPQNLARAAVEAWQHEDEVMPESETPVQREARTRAWTLALLGSIVNERGRTEGSEVVVPLRGDVLDAAFAAADNPLG
jgi:ferric-dicitrate binding protein FerR (iron transport regulator)